MSSSRPLIPRRKKESARLSTRPLVRGTPLPSAQKKNRSPMRPKIGSLTWIVLAVDREFTPDGLAVIVTLYNDFAGVCSVTSLPYPLGRATVVAFFGKVARVTESPQGLRYLGYTFILRSQEISGPRYRYADITRRALHRMSMEDIDSYDRDEWASAKAVEFAADQPSDQFPYGPALIWSLVEWVYDPLQPDAARPEVWLMRPGDKIAVRAEISLAQARSGKLLEESRYIGDEVILSEDDTKHCGEKQLDLWIDPISLEPIPTKALVTINGRCYNAITLAEWVEHVVREGVDPADPFTSAPLNQEQLNKIKRIAKIAARAR